MELLNRKTLTKNKNNVMHVLHNQYLNLGF